MTLDHLVAWTTVAANVATFLALFVGGGIALRISASLDLRANLERRMLAIQEAQVDRSLTPPPAGSDWVQAMLHGVNLWLNEDEKRFAQGYAPDELRRLAAKDRAAYLLWLSKYVNALDIALHKDWDGRPEVRKQIGVYLAPHAAALTSGWLTRRPRFLVSAGMAEIIRDLAT